MLLIILQIYTNSLQYTQISIETIFDQIPTYSLFSQIWYSTFSIIFRHRKTFRSYSYFFTFHFRSFSYFHFRSNSDFSFRSIPKPVYFCFDNSISPNEWHCFMQSLKYICRMEVLYISVTFVSPIQFSSLSDSISSPPAHSDT